MTCTFVLQSLRQQHFAHRRDRRTLSTRLHAVSYTKSAVDGRAHEAECCEETGSTTNGRRIPGVDYGRRRAGWKVQEIVCVGDEVLL